MNPNGTPAVSVVIPTRNRRDQLDACLRGLIGQSLSDFEALVMDQSDNQGSAEVVEALGDRRIRLHHLERAGANRARNLGAAKASSSLVAFLDDDCWPRPQWLENIVSTFGADPELQFIFGTLRAPDPPQIGGWYPEFLPDSFPAGYRGRRLAMSAAGANMSGRKAFLNTIGGFDELPGGTGPDVSDVSLAYRVLRSCAKWEARSDVEVVHLNGFRPMAELRRLYHSYAREHGLAYGRFVRRRDLYAAWCFLADQAEIGGKACVALIRTGRPRGGQLLVARAAGFLEGLKIPAGAGNVTGARLSELSLEFGALDSEESHMVGAPETCICR